VAAGSQCDSCRKFVPQHAPGLLYLVQQPTEPPSFVESMLGCRAEPLTFCSMRCVAEYAYVQVVTSDRATGTEPPS
jgi:hypothetical protein